MMQSIFSNFNYNMNFGFNPFPLPPMNISVPSFFMPTFFSGFNMSMGLFPTNFNMSSFGSIFSYCSPSTYAPPIITTSNPFVTTVPAQTVSSDESNASTPTVETSKPATTPSSVSDTKAKATQSQTRDNNISNRGYDPNALKNLRNASILKHVPEARKTAILDIVNRAAKQHNVDPKIILSIIYAESSFNPNACSHCGAMGLMQLMPATARQYGAKNPYDMEQNIFAGTKFLSWLLKRYNGNVRLAAAAYNVGPGRVKDSVSRIKETQNYVAKVTQTLNSLA